MTATLTRFPSSSTCGRSDERAPWFYLDGEPLGFEAGDANVRRYVGNSPTNATDPSGLDRELPWYSYPNTVGRVEDTVFGWISALMWGDNPKNAKQYARERAAYEQQRYEKLVAAPKLKPDESALAASVRGAGFGAKKGYVVFVDALALGSDPAYRAAAGSFCQDAVERGDVVTQVGLGAGKVGAHSAQAAFIVAAAPIVVEGAAGALGEGATLAVAELFGSAKVQTVFIVMSAASAANNAERAYEAAQQGNYIVTVDAAGSAAIDALLVGDMSRNLYKSQMAKALQAEVNSLHDALPAGPSRNTTSLTLTDAVARNGSPVRFLTQNSSANSATWVDPRIRTAFNGGSPLPVSGESVPRSQLTTSDGATYVLVPAAGSGGRVQSFVVRTPAGKIHSEIAAKDLQKLGFREIRSATSRAHCIECAPEMAGSNTVTPAQHSPVFDYRTGAGSVRPLTAESTYTGPKTYRINEMPTAVGMRAPLGRREDDR